MEEILRYACQLGEGLRSAYDHGILHRDIKPANAMFSEDGDLKLVDFGLAKFTEAPSLTEPGTEPGTLSYMAPELLNGDEASVASDVYALGAVLYEMASGRPMYRGESMQALASQVMRGKPEPLGKLRPDLPTYLTEAVRQATARDVAHRTPSAKALLERLGLMESAPSARDSTMTLVSRVGRPKRARVGLLGGAALAIAGAAGALFLPRKHWFAPVPVAAQTVVVLPFENLAGDKEDQSLSDGCKRP